MALESVNNNSKLLQNYELVLLEADSRCQADMVMKIFIRYITNTTHQTAGIVGMNGSNFHEISLIRKGHCWLREMIVIVNKKCFCTLSVLLGNALQQLYQD